MKQKEIVVLMVKPGESPKLTTLTNTLDNLQKAVSIDASSQGLIEILSLEKDVCILCNEEGKLIGLEPNRRLGNDILVGVFYVTGQDKNGNLMSLPETKIPKYAKLFEKPHTEISDDDVLKTIEANFFIM